MSGRAGYRVLVVGTLGSEIQGAAACERCGALVGGQDRETHDLWHAFPDDPTTTSISDVLHELEDLVERAHGVDETAVREVIGWINEMRSAWPYNTLVRRLKTSTGEPTDG